MSNRAVAAQLGVAESTIRNWRKELEDSTAQNYAVDNAPDDAQLRKSAQLNPPAQRIGTDGKAYDLGKRQQANEGRSMPTRQAVAPNPPALPAPTPAPKPNVDSPDQLKRQIVRDLRGISESLDRIEAREYASQVDEFIDFLCREWGVG
jgi:transposase-like protein